MLIKEIDTKLNSFEIFTIFKDEYRPFFLDSGMDRERLGQFSFIGFNPLLVFKSKDDNIEIAEHDNISIFKGNPLDKLNEIYNKYKMNYESELPFIGGFVGYLSYDLCHHIEKLPRTAVNDVNIPDIHFGIYDGVIVIDHRGNKDKVYVASLGLEEKEDIIVESIVKRIEENEENGVEIHLPNVSTKKEFKSNFTKDEYIKSIQKTRDYIKSGDIYIINLTQRFECDMEETPYELYGKLRDINPAPFSSYLDFGEGYIVSSSPERFLKLKNNILETRPIKGTRPRGTTEAEDLKNREELINSEKDKAELLMIVDLERNDLGKISEVGSVKVTELFVIEEYPTVFHLVSTVTSKMKENLTPIDCIKATFPGGSITGAPKIRAMEVIDELEPTQRNIYTGSIGYIGLNGDMDINIVIRTVVCKDNKAYFQVGGGIVWDSNPEFEYQETLDKAKALMEALNK